MRYAMLAAVAGAAILAGCSRNDGAANGNAGADQVTSSAGAPVTGNASAPVQQTGIAGVTANPMAAVQDCLSAQDQTRRPEDFPPEERAQKIGCINSAVAAQINRQLPAKVDAVTTLKHIDSEGTTLTYNYSVDLGGRTLPPGAIDGVKNQAKTAACANPQIRQTLSYGGVYVYRWADQNDRPLGELRIDAC